MQAELKRKRERMRAAGRLARRCLDALGARLRPGISGAELDCFAEKLIVSGGGRPAFKGYRGYPASICFSPNEVVIHGIPGPGALREGDIVSLDLGVEKDGYFADLAATYPVGEISREKAALLRATRQALDAAIERVRPGVIVDDLGQAVSTVAGQAGFKVVRSFCGHGIGSELHEPPEVPNYPSGNRFRLAAGLALAIEPMVNYSTCDVHVAADGWTVLTADGKPSAHFEETVFVLPEGFEIVTRV